MKPVLLHYYITNRCNARCEFCSIWREHDKIDSKLQEVVENLKAAKIAGCRFVDFTGGEPLLHNDLPIYLKTAKSLGFITSITTNCIEFEKKAASLAGLVDLLHFSIDADSEVLHNKIRGSNSFNSVLRSIPAALKNDLVPDLLFTYTNENIRSFRGVYEIALKNKLMVILDPVFSLDGKDIVSKQTHELAFTYASLKGVYLNKAHCRLRSAGGNDIDSPVCKAVSSTIVILPDNTLAMPCYHHAQAFVPIASNLGKALESSQRSDEEAQQGRSMFCKGCHINCYFDPSFTFGPSPLFFPSIIAKTKYAFTKYIRYKRKWPLGLTKKCASNIDMA